MSVCAAGSVLAASFDDRIETLFRPPLAEMIALSPDGHRIAYTSQTGRELSIIIANLEPPGARRTIKVEPEQSGEAAPEREPQRLRFLRWATTDRLVFAPVERVVPLPPVIAPNGQAEPNPDGPTISSPILAVDSDGRQRGTLIDARDFMDTPAEARKTLADFLRTTKELVASKPEPVRWKMPHVDILGFLPNDRQQLIIGTRGSFSMPAQHLVDTRTGTVREFGGDWPTPPGEPQVFDWFRLKVVGERTAAARPLTTWRDEELARLQRELETKFPRRVLEILDWSDNRARVLFRVTGGSDPGRLFVHQRPEDLELEILRRAPWLTAAKLNDTRFFDFAASDGARLSGYLTWPSTAPPVPPALVMILPSGFPGHSQPAFDPEAQVLADMGFAVARLNHRAAGGVRKEDLSAIRAGVDRVSIDDVRATIDWLAGSQPGRAFDRKRIAVLGRGFGGYLAVRGLQLQPSVFRCAIAIDAPMDLHAWLRATNRPGVARSAQAVPAALLDHGAADWKTLSAVEQCEALTNPVLLLVEPGRQPAVDVAARELCARLQALGRTAELHELTPNFATAEPAARAGVYRKIGEFLTLHLQTYAVKIGQTGEVK